jgi:hypothetical protein
VTLDAIGISMKALVHVMNLFLITFVIFTLAGVSLYQTSFQRRCVLPQGAPSVCCECARGKRRDQNKVSQTSIELQPLATHNDCCCAWSRHEQ